jgi:mRNA interferase MazF
VGFPLTLSCEAAGLPKQSWIKISQIRTLAVERIGARIARAGSDILEQSLEGLDEILGP